MYRGVFMLFQSMLNFIYLFLRVSGGQNFPPPLPTEVEYEYFKKAKQGDALAREKLIEHNLRLVAHIVKKYYTSNKNQEDLISVGTNGTITLRSNLLPPTQLIKLFLSIVIIKTPFELFE